MSNRRKFIHQTILGISGTALIPVLGKASNTSINSTHSVSEPLSIGVAGYSFAKFTLDQSIVMMKRIGVSNLSLKEIHLPLNSTDEQIGNAMAKFKAAGINIYTVGVIYMKSKEAVDTAFAYAKKCGVNMIVGVPNYDLIEYAEQKVKEYDIKLAIHNHGPEDALYPAPGDVYNRIKNLDARMGMCIDIGHSLRAGTLPEKAIREFKDRLFDLHIKDINSATKDGKGIEFGRGVINFGAVIESLRKVKFKGVCSIEFEKDMSDPLPGIAESVGYFKGRMAAED
ncbi:MAG: sugar phosphate isomerase/epimerase family protein [Sediminibacterium sp.]|jgi:inosose dehydratase